MIFIYLLFLLLLIIIIDIISIHFIILYSHLGQDSLEEEMISVGLSRENKGKIWLLLMLFYKKYFINTNFVIKMQIIFW